MVVILLFCVFLVQKVFFSCCTYLVAVIFSSSINRSLLAGDEHDAASLWCTNVLYTVSCDSRNVTLATIKHILLATLHSSCISRIVLHLLFLCLQQCYLHISCIPLLLSSMLPIFLPTAPHRTAPHRHHGPQTFSRVQSCLSCLEHGVFVIQIYIWIIVIFLANRKKLLVIILYLPLNNGILYKGKFIITFYEGNLPL